MRNPLSVSTAPSNKLVGRPFYDLQATLEVMKRFWRESILDGFEFQNTAEWDAENPPRDERERRLAYWEHSQRYTTDQLAALLRQTGLPILSIHANRDVGICLGSAEPSEIDTGKRLIHESLSLADQVGAQVCVFHLWDTRGEAFDVGFPHSVLSEIAAQYPSVKAAVENIPTHLPGLTPFALVKECEWITLDLRWVALYDELDKFESLKNRIANVHLRGELEHGKWVIPPAWFASQQKSFGFYGALDTVRDRWGYSGLLTVESIPRDSDWETLIAAIASLQETQR